jgi:hypothetical protein
VPAEIRAKGLQDTGIGVGHYRYSHLSDTVCWNSTGRTDSWPCLALRTERPCSLAARSSLQASKRSLASNTKSEWEDKRSQNMAREGQ